jgi:hypothetical protein
MLNINDVVWMFLSLNSSAMDLAYIGLMDILSPT